MFAKKTLIGACIALLLLANYGTARAKDIIMGLVPAENNEEMVAKFEPMRAYLEKKLGQKVKVFTATDYAGVYPSIKVIASSGYANDPIMSNPSDYGFAGRLIKPYRRSDLISVLGSVLPDFA